MQDVKAELVVVIKLSPEGKVVVEGTIMNEIVTYGLIEKGKRVLDKHYANLAESRIVKPDLVMPAIVGKQ